MLGKKPIGNCWDSEYKNIFKKNNIQVKINDRMYTSIHYLINPKKKSGLTVELQVRTLMDEVWAEVSHTVDYPDESNSRACRDQLKVLARLTTGGTRLVDSIFKSHEEG